MPWTGDGGFTRNNGVDSGATVWTAAETAARTINGAEHDAHDEDLADGLENCVTRDGQNAPTANLPMGAHKHTGVADATADTEYAAWGQVKTRIAAPLAFAALTWTSPLAWDLATHPSATLEMTGNVSELTLSNGADGGIYILRIVQDATGGRTMTFPAGWLWPNGGDSQPLSTAANAVDTLTLLRVGTVVHAVLTRDWRTAP